MNNSVETKKAEVRKNIENVFESATKKIQNIISVCPGWKFVNVQNSRNQVKVKFALACDENRELTVVYNECKCGFHGNVEFTTEIDAASSIDIDSANCKAMYYIALGSFLSNKDLQDKLQSEMKSFLHNVETKYNEYNKLDQED